MNVHSLPAAAATYGSADAWLRRPQDFVTGQLERLRENRHAISKNSAEEILPTKRLEFMWPEEIQTNEDKNSLKISIDGAPPIAVSHHAFGQLCGLVPEARTRFLRSLPAQIAGPALEYGLHILAHTEEIKTYASPDLLRAITSPTYGRVPDYQVVDAVQDSFAGRGWTVAEDYMAARASDKAMSIFLIDKERPMTIGKDPNGDPDLLYRGIMFRNSEVGYTSLSVEAFLFRDYCCNGCIFGLADFERIRVVHSKRAPERWVHEVMPAIEHFAQSDGTTLMQAIERCRQNVVADDDKAAIAWLNRRGVSRKLADRVLALHEAEERRPARTLWDMAQGLSAAARDLSFGDDRIEAEQEAGRLLALAA